LLDNLDPGEAAGPHGEAGYTMSEKFRALLLLSIRRGEGID
jgi:hypothetical protein